MKTSDIYSLSDFNRKPSEHIRRVQETQQAEVLTVNGKAAVVVVAPEHYDQLVRDAELSATLRNFAQANQQLATGNSSSSAEVLERLQKALTAKPANEL